MVEGFDHAFWNACLANHEPSVATRVTFRTVWHVPICMGSSVCGLDAVITHLLPSGLFILMVRGCQSVELELL